MSLIKNQIDHVQTMCMYPAGCDDELLVNFYSRCNIMYVMSLTNISALRDPGLVILQCCSGMYIRTCLLVYKV